MKIWTLVSILFIFLSCLWIYCLSFSFSISEISNLRDAINELFDELNVPEHAKEWYFDNVMYPVTRILVFTLFLIFIALTISFGALYLEAKVVQR